MANSKVGLLRYVNIGGWRRIRVDVIHRRRGWDERLDALGGQEILEKGQFELRWYMGSRAVYKGVGLDLQEAITARDIRSLILRRTCSSCGRTYARVSGSRGPGVR